MDWKVVVASCWLYISQNNQQVSFDQNYYQFKAALNGSLHFLSKAFLLINYIDYIIQSVHIKIICQNLIHVYINKYDGQILHEETDSGIRLINNSLSICSRIFLKIVLKKDSSLGIIINRDQYFYFYIPLSVWGSTLFDKFSPCLYLQCLDSQSAVLKPTGHIGQLYTSTILLKTIEYKDK